MLYVLNPDNYGLKIDGSIVIDIAILKEKGIKIYNSEHELNLALCECLELSLEEVEGSLPLITYRDSSFFQVCDRGLISEIEEQDIYKYLAEYIL